MALIITQAQIEEVLTMTDTVEAVEAAFRAHCLGQTQMPPKLYLTFDRGDLRAMPAYIHTPTLNVAGIKSVSVHPRNKELGLPTVMAVIIIVDPDTGQTQAILDGTLITAMRTGAAGAVASKYLAREDAKTAAFIGCGRQARALLEGLLSVRHLRAVQLYDWTPQNAALYKNWALAKFPFLAVTACESVEAACRGADIVTTCTPSTTPFLKRVYLEPGTHINAMGADAKGKEELFPEVLLNAKVVVDDWAQASHSGEINVPLDAAIIDQDHIYAEMGYIVAGKLPGRESDGEITVFDSTGLAIQDIAAAGLVLARLKDVAGLQKAEFF